jgi:hypothetical protein
VADQLGRKPAEQEALLRVLVQYEVEFLVLGGIAVYVHGYTRLTEDVDILPNPSTPNMRRLGAALADLKRYRKLEANAVEAQLDELTIRVLGKDDLIDMKREAGRDKDLRDIAALTEVERHGGDR